MRSHVTARFRECFAALPEPVQRQARNACSLFSKFRGNKLVLKWDIDRQRPLLGVAPRRLRKLLRELQREGRL